MLENIKRKKLQISKYDLRISRNLHLALKFKRDDGAVQWFKDIVRYQNHVTNFGTQRYASGYPLKDGFSTYTKIPEICDTEHKPRLYPEYLTNIKTNELLWFNMIRCDVGSFVHKQAIFFEPHTEMQTIEIKRPFLLGETEVTQELYEFVMGSSANPSKFRTNTTFRDVTKESFYPFLTKQHPVEMISLEKVINFCNKLSETQRLEPCFFSILENGKRIWICKFNANGYRLPTSNEWLYAAKAGTDNLWAGTSDPADLPKYAVYGNSKQGSTQPVRTKLPNEWGFYDMTGNVDEWCWGDTSKGYYKINGGNFTNQPNDLKFESLTNLWQKPTEPMAMIGFRIARTIFDN